MMFKVRGITDFVPTLCVGMHTSVVIRGSGMGYHAERGNQKEEIIALDKESEAILAGIKKVIG